MELAFQLKGRLFTLSVLQMVSTDISLIEQQLNQKIKQAPQFFNNTPMVIDLTGIDEQIDNINLTALMSMLKKYKIIPVGFVAHSEQAKAAIESSSLPLIKEARATAQAKDTNRDNSKSTTKRSATNESSSKPCSTIITKQVRSGQQIYAPDGDLIVTAPVSSGAELLAQGNIHVYGSLRGRALAGINGDVDARIFCKSLEADIVSIAGQYKLLDDTNDYLSTKQPYQVYLQNGQLIIKAI